MTKPNVRGGKKHKRGKKTNPTDEQKGKTEFAENNQIYAKVIKREGGGRIKVDCSDGKIRSAIIPGKMKKRTWMNEGDIILCDLETENQQDICYIAKKYTPKDVAILKKNNLITFEIDDIEQGNYNFDEEEEEKVKKTDNWDPYAGLSSSEEDDELDNKNKKNSDSSDKYDIDEL